MVESEEQIETPRNQDVVSDLSPALEVHQKDEAEGSSNVVVQVVVHQDREQQQSNIDKLRIELSCAICLELCYEPTTTPCGHSFCRKCLKSSVEKGNRTCPKCRELISNDSSFSVNIVIWNTIQLLFPEEVKARKVHLQKPPPPEPELHPVIESIFQFIFRILAVVVIVVGIVFFGVHFYLIIYAFIYYF